MYEVLDTGRPAKLSSTGPWANNQFPSFVEALEYALDWLGPYAPSDKDLLAPGLMYIYNGLDYMEIRKVE